MSRKKFPNPLNVPYYLVTEAHGTFPDMLEVVLGYIDQLPPAFRKSLEVHLCGEDDRIDDLRFLLSGIRKIRDGVMPNDDELSIIEGPSDDFAALVWGFEEAVSREQLTIDQEMFVEENIIKPLKELQKSKLAHPVVEAMNREWIDRLLEARGDEELHPTRTPKQFNLPPRFLPYLDPK